MQAMYHYNGGLRMCKTIEEARGEFVTTGRSIADWSRQNRFNVNLVYAVLAGKRRALRGQTHDIAVSLGIKEGLTRAKQRGATNTGRR